MKQAPIGMLLTCDINTKSPGVLENAQVEKACKALIKQFKLNSVSELKHEFTPQGLSLVYILAESSLTIHTWPEKGYAALDVFYCNLSRDLSKLEDFLKKAFETETVTIKKLNRC